MPGRVRDMRASAASEPRERSAPAKRRARERVGESEGRSPSVKNEVRMAKAAVATQSVDFEAIDRLEQKLKMLVTVLDRTRAESARATHELGRARADYA